MSDLDDIEIDGKRLDEHLKEYNSMRDNIRFARNLFTRFRRFRNNDSNKNNSSGGGNIQSNINCKAKPSGE